MTDSPILFSAPMVRALLGGRKTQTRRIVSRGRTLMDGGPWPKGLFEKQDFSRAYVDPGPSPLGNPGPYLHVSERVEDPDDEVWHRVYPRVQPGDRMWVKESFRTNDGGSVLYVATDHAHELRREHPSIHMPMAASRLTLHVSEVRMQRLQEITEEDARAEGCFVGKASGRVFESESAMHFGGDQWASPRQWYRDLFETINGTRTWDGNPWVLVYTFAVEPLNIADARVAS